jgi:hypothetical protein
MTFSKCAFSAIGTMVLAACSGTGEGEHEPEPIDVQVQSLDQATELLARIHDLQVLDPKDARAADALERLMPVLDRLNHLIARVEPSAGHVVSFYEPDPGHLAISERGPVDQARYLDSPKLRDLSAVDLYRTLAGEEAPEALHLADSRRASTGGVLADAEGGSAAASPVQESRPVTAPARTGDVGTAAQALTGADGPWFTANICYKSGDFRGCNPNWANGGYAYANTKTSFFTVAPYAGNYVQVRMQYEDSTKFTDVAYPGQLLNWWYHSDTVDWPCGFLIACGHDEYNNRKHRWDIINASGDSFHWTYSFKWSCGTTLSCDSWPAQ